MSVITDQNNQKSRDYTRDYTSDLGHFYLKCCKVKQSSYSDGKSHVIRERETRVKGGAQVVQLMTRLQDITAANLFKTKRCNLLFNATFLKSYWVTCVLLRSTFWACVKNGFTLAFGTVVDTNETWLCTNYIAIYILSIQGWRTILIRKSGWRKNKKTNSRGYN